MKKLLAAFALTLLAAAGAYGADRLGTRGGGINSVATDTAPDQIAFQNLTGQALSATVTGQAYTPLGYKASTSWGVTSGSCTIQVNGTGSFALSGTVAPGQTLTPRTTSSSSYNTAVACTIAAGGIASASWIVTTVADPGGCMTATQQYVAFFNLGSCSMVSTTTESTMTASFATRNTVRNTYMPMHTTQTCSGNPPAYYFQNGGGSMAQYGVGHEAIVNAYRGGADDRAASDCYMDYWVFNDLKNGWFPREPQSDMVSHFAMCKNGRSTSHYTAAQWCNTVAANILDTFLQWYIGGSYRDPQGNNGGIVSPSMVDASGRIWAHILEASMYSAYLGLASPYTGLNHTTVAQDIVTRIKNIQHGNGNWYLSYNPYNNSMQTFQQAMVAYALSLHYDNFNQDATTLSAIKNWAEWFWSTALATCFTNVKCYAHYNLPYYNTQEGFDIDPGSGLNGFYEKIFAWLYQRDGDPAWRSRMLLLQNSRLNRPYSGGDGGAWFTGGLDTPSVKERCESFCNDWRNATAYEATVSAPSRPSMTVRPTISGTVKVGSHLMLSTGTWANCASCTYQYRWVTYVPGTSTSTSGQYFVIGQTTNDLLIPAGSGRTYIGNVRASADDGATWSLWEPTARTSATP